MRLRIDILHIGSKIEYVAREQSVRGNLQILKIKPRWFCQKTVRNDNNWVLLKPLIVIIFIAFSGCQKFDFKNPVDSSLQLQAPNNIRIISLTESSVQLSWTDVNSFTAEQRNNVKIEFEQSTDSSMFSPVFNVSIDSLSVTIPGTFGASAKYYFRAKLIAGSNFSPYSSPVSSELIFNAPDNVQLINNADTAVVLRWNNTNPFVTHFEIEQSINGSPFVLRQTVANDTITVRINDIFIDHVIYSYRIRGRSSNNVTSYSPSVSSELVFNAPDNVQLQSYADTAVVLQWKSANPYIKHFEIEQSINGSQFVVRQIVSNTITTVRMTDVFIDHNIYSYRIRGRSSNNVTPYSIVATHTALLEQPTGLSTKHLSLNTIELRWNDNSSYEKDFVVERKTNTGDFIQIGINTANTTLYTDNGLDCSQRYEYRIRARSGYNANNVSQSIAINYTMKDVGLFKTVSGHTSAVFAVAVHPHNNMFASGSGDKTIKLWDSNGTFLRTLSGHAGQVYAVAFSPDGQWLFSGSLDGTAKIWRVADGTLQYTLVGHTSAIYAISVSPDGKTIASASFDKTIRLWKASDGEYLRTLNGHNQGIYAVTFSPNGSLIASAGIDRTIKVWRVSDGAVVWNLTGHTNTITGLSFTPDGNTLLSGSYDNSIKFWRMTNGALIRTIQNDSNSVSSLALSTDGKKLLCGNIQEHFQIWNTDNYSLIQSTYAHTDAVDAVAVNSSMQWFVTGGGDALVKLWRVNNEWVKE